MEVLMDVTKSIVETVVGTRITLTLDAGELRRFGRIMLAQANGDNPEEGEKTTAVAQEIVERLDFDGDNTCKQ
jgi:hypothetical protein